MCNSSKGEETNLGIWSHVWERTDVTKGSQRRTSSSLHKTEDIPRRGNNFKDKGNFREDNETNKQKNQSNFYLFKKALLLQSFIQII